MNDNSQPVVKASMWHQRRDAAQWQHHRIKRIEKYSDMSTINQGQQQTINKQWHHVHRCRVNRSSIAVPVAVQHAMASQNFIFERQSISGDGQQRQVAFAERWCRIDDRGVWWQLLPCNKRRCQEKQLWKHCSSCCCATASGKAVAAACSQLLQCTKQWHQEWCGFANFID